METVLMDAVRSVPGLAFAAWVFWLVSGLWQKQLEESGKEREAHRAVIDAVVKAYEESVANMIDSSDRRQAECSQRCIEAINRITGVRE
jgi:sensor histidine kinase regulating citrate/malate metabolism